MEKQRKKLLMYANYYYPEVASTAQLCTELCGGLKEYFDITVICAVPCYTGKIDKKYLTKSYYFEEYDGVKIIRVKVSEFDKQNKVSRVKHIMSYFWRSILATFKVDKPDYIFTISQPPILGGLLGVFGKVISFFRGKKSKMIYNIQDYNPEQTMAVGYSKNKIVLKAMMAFDKFSCCIADKVIVVGRDMLDTMTKRFTKKNGIVSKRRPDTVFINNWMDDKEVYPLSQDNEKVIEFKKKYNLNDKFVIMYSGNIGLYYDLENLFKVIEKFGTGTKTKSGKEVIFAFVGAGSVLDKLLSYKEEKNMENVIFIPYQAKEDLIYSLNAADVHWCVNAKGIKGVSCPSKYYGIAASGKPVLGVLEEGSEIRFLIEETKGGLVSEPGDYNSVENNIRWFIENADSDELEKMGKRSRDYLVENLTKGVSVEKYRKEILGC